MGVAVGELSDGHGHVAETHKLETAWYLIFKKYIHDEI